MEKTNINHIGSYCYGRTVGNIPISEGIVMKNKKVFSLLILAGLCSAAYAENVVKADPAENLESKSYVSGDKIKLIRDSGETIDAVIERSDDNIGIVRIPKEEKAYFHGNWLAEYKIEHFRNEGRSTNSRPVHEIVFADGRVNFGDTGWNSGFLLKQVHFTSDSRNESKHKVDFRMIEMEIRPAWSKNIDKHWFMLEGIYLGKTGYEKNRTTGSDHNIGGDGYGFRPYYRYQFSDNFSVNTDIKMLVEDKDARGADSGRFQFYEALVNFNYRAADRVNVGFEVFRKEGQDYNHDRHKTANVLEQEFRPWVAWSMGKSNFLFKMEPQLKRIGGNNGYKETSKTQKYIFNYSYPVVDNFYLVAEYFYRVEYNKEFWDNNQRDHNSYKDTITHFGKLGFNYVF